MTRTPPPEDRAKRKRVVEQPPLVPQRGAQPKAQPGTPLRHSPGSRSQPEPVFVPSGLQHGVVVMFDPDRGFGFIRPQGTARKTRSGAGQEQDSGPAPVADVFVHIRNVNGRRRLYPGQQVTYHVTRGDKGLAAINVEPGSVLTIPYLRYSLVGLGSAAVLLAFLASVANRPGSLALWLVLWCAALSISTFFMYGYDKAQAPAGGTRVPEVVLLGLAALGGSPGAFLGMRLFHHKTITRSFQVIFWLIVACQAAVILYLVVLRRI